MTTPDRRVPEGEREGMERALEDWQASVHTIEAEDGPSGFEAGWKAALAQQEAERLLRAHWQSMGLDPDAMATLDTIDANARNAWLERAEWSLTAAAREGNEG